MSTIEVDGTITHGSYNATANNAGKLYVANFGDDSAVTSYSDKKTLSDATTNATQPTADSHSCWWAGSYTEGESSKNIWYAVAWKMEFTTTHGVDDNMSLFVDYNSCTFTDSVENGDTIKGLRIALMTSTNVRVIGGEAETNHVTGETTTDVKKFDTGIYHQAGESYAKATDKTDFTTNVGYLGAMTKVGADTSKTTSSLDVTAVAWFEGESTNVVSDKNMSKVVASLSFYARINAEA